jgi:peptidoglycan/LPS O-acetylase OafA/YrhL
MVAVVAVVLDHLIGWPSGGFVGVDVFFVLSGFLITGLLLREHERTGTISFSGFYRRRLKRIAPAATVVLIAVVIAGFVIFTRVRADQTMWDAIWAFFFAANWHFAAAGTDYFQAGLAVSPIQHFWSLAVEEQFYFIWPWLMLLIFTIATRRNRTNRTARRAIGTAMIVLSAASFAWAMWETQTSPTWAYFSTFSRAWELGLGAIIAVAAPLLTLLPNAVRPILAWVGLAGIVLSLFVVSDEVAFPAPWAALPVIATVLVIAAGTGGQHRFLWPLTNPVSVWLGDISYSLYLWHFPVIIFLGVLMPEGPMYFGIAAAGMLALAVASYYGVENPIRNSEWLVPRAERAPKKRRSRASTASFNRTVTGVLLGTLVVATVALIGVALLPRTSPLPANALLAAPAPTESAAPAPVSDNPEDTLKAQVALALKATEWPALTPSLDQLGEAAWAPEIINDGCLSVEDEDLDACRFGDGEKLAVLVGDSIAASWIPALRAALEPQGYSLQVLTKSGCPFFDVTPKGDTQGECAEHRSWEIEKANTLQPALTIISNAFEDNLEEGEDPSSELKVSTWREGGERSAAKLTSATPVVMLSAPPGGEDPNQCVTIASKPADCVGDVSGFYTQIEQANKAVMTTADLPGTTTYLNTQPWFCVSSKCPLFVGTTPVRIDVAHLTGVYSQSLGPVMWQAIAPLVAAP